MPIIATTSRYLQNNPNFVENLTGFPLRLPGFFEGGDASQRRNQLTDFGSGWKGLKTSTRILKRASKTIPKLTHEEKYFMERFGYLPWMPIGKEPARIKEALQHKGMAGIRRKKITDFGSKWQGILRAVKGFRQEGVVFEVHPRSFLQKVGGNVGVERGVVEELKTKILQGIQLDPGEIFFDEFNNIIGAEGRHRATAYMELNRQMPVRRLVREVMDAGEGESATSSLPRRTEVTGSRKTPKSL